MAGIAQQKPTFELPLRGDSATIPWLEYTISRPLSGSVRRQIEMGMGPFFICGGISVDERHMSMAQEELIERTLAGLGYELVDFEKSPRARLLRIFIDAPEGVTIDDCAEVSNHLTRLFAVENIDYDRLEVSSPGLDRPLKKAGDYERFAGHEAQVRTRLPVNGQRNFTGVIVALKDGVVHLQSAEHAYELPLEQIDKARLVAKL